MIFLPTESSRFMLSRKTLERFCPWLRLERHFRRTWRGKARRRAIEGCLAWEAAARRRLCERIEEPNRGYIGEYDPAKPLLISFKGYRIISTPGGK